MAKEKSPINGFVQLTADNSPIPGMFHGSLTVLPEEVGTVYSHLDEDHCGCVNRRVRKNWVRELADNIQNVAKLSRLTLYKHKNGKIFVLDGHHRLEAVKLCQQPVSFADVLVLTDAYLKYRDLEVPQLVFDINYQRLWDTGDQLRLHKSDWKRIFEEEGLFGVSDMQRRNGLSWFRIVRASLWAKLCQSVGRLTYRKRERRLTLAEQEHWESFEEEGIRTVARALLWWSEFVMSKGHKERGNLFSETSLALAILLYIENRDKPQAMRGSLDRLETMPLDNADMLRYKMARHNIEDVARCVLPHLNYRRSSAKSMFTLFGETYRQ